MFKLFFGTTISHDETPDGEDGDFPPFNNMKNRDIAIFMARGTNKEDPLETIQSEAYSVCVKILRKTRKQRRDHYYNGMSFIYTLYSLGITNSKLEDFYTYVCNEELEKLEEILWLYNSKKIEASTILEALEDKALLTISKDKIEIKEKKDLNTHFVGYEL